MTSDRTQGFPGIVRHRGTPAEPLPFSNS
jgi:hypothetical protein